MLVRDQPSAHLAATAGPLATEAGVCEQCSPHVMIDAFLEETRDTGPPGKARPRSNLTCCGRCVRQSTEVPGRR